MHKLVFTETVQISAPAVWAVIGDFGNLSIWTTRVVSQRIETGPEGIYRIIAHESGKVFRERLVCNGSRFYTYAVDRTGTDHYEATVAVESIDERSARIALSVQFKPKSGIDEAGLVEDISAFFRSSLKAMKRAVGVSATARSIP